MNPWAVFLLSLFLFLPANLAVAQSESSSCRENATEVITAGENLRLRDYICETPNGARIRVQLHRVSDAVADAIIQRTLPTALEPVLGGTELIDNPVSERFKELMDKFAEKQGYACETINQLAPGGQETYHRDDCEGNGKRRTLGGWDGSSVGPFPAAADMEHMLSNNALPPTYTISPDSSGEQTTGWRPMRLKDIENLDTKIKDFNLLAARAKQSVSPRNMISQARELRFYRYLADGNLPKGFSAIEASLSYICGDDGREWVIHYPHRSMMVEIAILENLTSKPVRFSGFWGVAGRSNKLRRPPALNYVKMAEVQNLGLAPITLGPGNRIALFQRMKLIVMHPPKGISLPIFDYGPAEYLRRFEANGHSVALERRDHNAALLTMSGEGGSCPYLYARAGNEWINYGKVLHKAQGAARKQWDAREFDGFLGSFRLTELEPELAVIDRAVLDVTLKSGDVLSLRPDREALANSDDRVEHIYMHEVVELRFDLPVGISKRDVSRSRIRLLGHYERYSTLFRSAGWMPKEPEPLYCPRPVKEQFDGAPTSNSLRQMVLAD